MPEPGQSFESKPSTVFVNREQWLDLIDESIVSIPQNGIKLLVFHGLGGQGKSALRHHVHQQLSDKEDSRYSHIKVALVDLHGRSKRDPLDLLILIRNSFAAAKLDFPSFDLALAVTWESSRSEEPFPILTNAWLAKTSEMLTQATPDAVTLVRETIEKTVETVPLVGPLTSWIMEWAIDTAKTAYVRHTRPYLDCLYDVSGRVRPPHELKDKLPGILAQDLNYHLKADPAMRFVLLVDEYEDVFDKAGAGKKYEDLPFDKAMRSFISNAAGILSIFFTRQPLPWERSAHWRDDLAGNQHNLDGLDQQYAHAWAQEAGVHNLDIRCAIIEGARESSEPNAFVYPLLLELQLKHWAQLTSAEIPIEADHFHTIEEARSDRCRELVGRVLRHYGAEMESTIEVLSVASLFDRKAFEYVVKSFNLQLEFEAFERLRNLSIMHDSQDGWVAPHRAVADAIVLQMSSGLLDKARAELVLHFGQRACPPMPIDVDNDTLRCFQEGARIRLTQGIEGYVPWLENHGKTIAAAGYLSVLETMAREALAIASDTLGHSHEDTARSYNIVGYLLMHQGRYQEAESYYRKGMDVRRALHGEVNADVAQSCDNLAGCLAKLDQFNEAEHLHRQALETRRITLGEHHVDTSHSHNNLACFLRDRDQYEAAEWHFRTALDIVVRALGEAHPEVAICCNNLAGNLRSQNKLEEAETLYRQSLAIRESTLGMGHADTGLNCHNLACLLDGDRRHEEAEAHFRRALQITRESLSEHEIGMQRIKTIWRGLRACLKAQNKVLSRNEVCPCGSQARFKKCCGTLKID